MQTTESSVFVLPVSKKLNLGTNKGALRGTFLILQRKQLKNYQHPVYKRWISTRSRCTNSKDPSYHNYGGRGICLSSDLLSFEDYSTYVMSLPNYDPVLKTLDRKDNSLGYQKGNLRWVSRSVQSANRAGAGHGTNKFTGVTWDTTFLKWLAKVISQKKVVFTKYCETQEEAVQVRNAFITQHALPHPLNNI